MHRAIPLFLLAVTLSLTAAPVLAVVDPEVQAGVVVSAGEGMLTVSDPDGQNEKTYTVAGNVQITLDGEPAELAALQKGFFVKIMTAQEGDGQVVVSIEATKTMP